MIKTVLFLAVGFLISFLSTPWIIRLSAGGIGLDTPNESRKQHGGAIPRLGGAPIMLAVSLSLILIFALDSSQSKRWFPVLLGSLLMYGLGLWDDLKPLGAKVKLAGQILTACLVYWLGLSIHKLSYPGGGWSVDLGMWSLPVTILWLIAVPNIINLIDGFDGLAGGLGIFLASTLGIVAIYNEQLPVAWYAFSMAGALLGFLVFNFPPAKIFLGDGGAYLIGFTIAALSLTSSNKASVAAVLLVTVVALGVPILDTAFAILRRGFRGFPLFHADADHIHHKMQRFGFSKRRILFAFYGISVVLSLLGLSVVWSQGRTLPVGIGALFLLAVLALRYFHFVRSWDDVVRKVDRLMTERRQVQYALLQAQILHLELERCRDAHEFWGLFDTTLHRVGFVKPVEGLVTMPIHVKHNGDEPWTLHRPCAAVIDETSHREWVRIAECFRPVYQRARTKWQS
ncbi:MAG TPA: MraY family glycosyltransferase [Chthoniobacteraceae bacterium]|jgi:UDP-GlcNAc:undecaprenyl-phosphate GlcNAc-1-phosphate transferase|nr:MraY family glycosyltransferase [Chthoniobacteraceae bacterium]